MITSGNALSQILTTDIGVKQLQDPKDFVGLRLFPLFKTPHISGSYWLINDGAMVDATPSLARSPGAPFGRSQTKLAGDQYWAEIYGHEEDLGQEDLEKYASPRAAQEAVARRVHRVLLLGHELRVKALATSAPVSSAAVAIPWTNPVSDPLSDVAVVRQAIFVACAREPNVMTVPRTAFETLKAHPSIKALVKISTADARWPDLLAGVFDVERFAVARGTVNAANEGQPISLTEIWEDSVMLAYVDQTEDLRAPSFGRTFIVTDEDNPFGVKIEAFANDPNKALMVRASQITAEKLTALKCGYRLYGMLS